jgi:hypothetical protein
VPTLPTSGWINHYQGPISKQITEVENSLLRGRKSTTKSHFESEHVNIFTNCFPKIHYLYYRPMFEPLGAGDKPDVRSTLHRQLYGRKFHSVQRDIRYSDYRTHRRLKMVKKNVSSGDVTMYVTMMQLQRCFRQFYQKLRFACSQSNHNTQHWINKVSINSSKQVFFLYKNYNSRWQGYYCWQIHLSAELKLPATSPCSLIISRSIVTTLPYRKIGLYVDDINYLKLQVNVTKYKKKI